MPTLDWKLKANTATTAKVFVRTDTTGTAKITVNGSDFVVSLDTAVKDGTGVISITGISGGESFILYLDGVQMATGIFTTFPVAGERYSIGWFSCLYANSKDTIALKQLRQEPRLQRVYDLGDTPYVGGERKQYNVVTATGTHSSLAFAKTVAAYHGQHLHTMRIASVKLLGHEVPYMDGADDHEWPGNDWDHTIAALENSSGFAGTTQADVDAVFIAGYEGIRDYAQGHPDNNHASALPQKPGDRGANPAITLTDADYPVSYYSEVLGDAEFFYLDNVTHRGPVGGDVSILGTNQWAWLQDKLKTSTATWKLIMSGKMIMQDLTANLDGYTKGAATEEAAIMAFCDASTDWVVPKGVLWLSGDDHIYMWSQSTSPDFSSVCACPISADVKARTPAPHNEILLGYAEKMLNHYGMVDIQGSTKLVVYIVDIIGNRRDVGTLYPNSNLLV